MEESVSNDELDHDNDEIKKFTENETTKIDIISVTNTNSQQFSFKSNCILLIMNIAAEKLN